MKLPECLADLAQYPRWVGWKWVELGNGKRDKPPRRLDHPEWNASTAKPAEWGFYSAGLRHVASGALDGVGYVTEPDHERIFVDLDDCRNPTTGRIDDWAQELVDAAESYTEITPSGCGLRIIGLAGGLPHPIHTPFRFAEGGHGEVYFRARRYVTVTGNRLDGTPDALRDIGDLALALLAKAGRHAAASAKPRQERRRNPFGFDPNNPPTPLADIVDALAQIPNPNLEWDDWIRIGLAVFRATDGSADGREAWRAWSAKSSKHDDDALDERWDHFGRSPPSSIGFGSLHYEATAARPDWVPPSWRPRETEAGADAEDPFAGVAEPPTSKPADPLDLLDFEAIEPSLDTADFVEGLLSDGAMSVAYGPSNVGKTFVVTDLGLHVAAGMAWHGREIEAGPVLYFAMEGGHGIRNRVALWKREHGFDGLSIPFAVAPYPVNLLDPADFERVRATFRAAEARHGRVARLAIFDTLNRAMGGANENASEDMGRLIAAADALRHEFGVHVLLIHHSGKDDSKGSRGHSSLRAALDTEIEVLRPEGQTIGTIRVRKQRDLPKDEDAYFRLDVLELGTNRRGKPVTSAIVRPVFADEAKPKSGYPEAYNKLTSDGARIAFRALVEAVQQEGRDHVPHPDIPRSVRAVPVDVWERTHARTYPAQTTNAKRMAFDRGSKTLVAKRLAVVVDGWAWIRWDEG